MWKKEFGCGPICAIGLAVILGAILGGCALDNWLPLEPGVYGPASNAMSSEALETLEVDRENQLATFHMAGGSRIVVPFSTRDRADWPSGCPTNISSSNMEILDIKQDTLTIGALSFSDPILVRDCPAEPEQIVLREDGLVVGGGSACANASRCLHFARQPEAASVESVPLVNTTPLPRSMKGYELYSWYHEDFNSWRYTLITGTNRLKAIEEITAEENQVAQSDWVKITVAGTEALKALLNRLPPGTELFWLGDERLEGASESYVNIMLPEASVLEAIESHCRQLNIQLNTSQ